ncbi:MAG TPA: nitrilase-related carbon-nitrogen hydrolase, partial [Thermomicrobiales bacterium]|nr:nitrilase-related carbon-nitrogen hydrolase [Thermomicrobiales bacterium]
MSEATGPEPIRVAALQIETPDDERLAARLERVTAMIAALPAVDLILLPEIWNIGYFNFDRYAAEAEAASGQTATALAAAAGGKGAYLLAGSIVERDGDDLFNVSLLFDRAGNLVASYRKIHLFGYGSAETRLLKPGREVVTAATDFGVVGLSTCYDLRFPELYRRQVD